MKKSCCHTYPSPTIVLGECTNCLLQLQQSGYKLRLIWGSFVMSELEGLLWLLSSFTEPVWILVIETLQFGVMPCWWLQVTPGPTISSPQWGVEDLVPVYGEEPPLLSQETQLRRGAKNPLSSRQNFQWFEHKDFASKCDIIMSKCLQWCK